MSKPKNLLIHALATHGRDPDTVRARATVRIGDSAVGDRLWFEGTDRIRRKREIAKIKRSHRLSTITLRATDDNRDHLVGGTCLYGSELMR